MKFEKDHEIFSRISIRVATDFDTDKIVEIIKSQPTMFGSDISQNWNYYINAVLNSLDKGLTVIGEIDGVVEGVMRINFWRKMPFWSVGSNFTMKRQGLEYIRHRALSLSMYEYCMKAAEADRRYDGYIIITDSGNKFNKRRMLHDKLMPITDRYIVNDVEIINPYSRSKYDMFNDLLGILRDKNEKAVVIRHNSLKTEFRS